MKQNKVKPIYFMMAFIVTISVFLIGQQLVVANDIYASGPPGPGGGNTGSTGGGGCNTSHCNPCNTSHCNPTTIKSSHHNSPKSLHKKHK